MLPRKEVNKIRAEYLIGETVEKLSKKYSCSPVTVTKYRDDEDWDTLKAMAQEKAALKAVDTIATRMARDMRVLEAAKMSMARNLKARLEAEEDLVFSAKEWNELDKGQALIDGRPTERHEHVNDGDGKPLPERLKAIVERLERTGIDLKLNGFEKFLASEVQTEH